MRVVGNPERRNGATSERWREGPQLVELGRWNACVDTVEAMSIGGKVSKEREKGKGCKKEEGKGGQEYDRMHEKWMADQENSSGGGRGRRTTKTHVSEMYPFLQLQRIGKKDSTQDSRLKRDGD